jgi:membrane protein implicated in regulation of membrane protease activity
MTPPQLPRPNDPAIVRGLRKAAAVVVAAAAVVLLVTVIIPTLMVFALIMAGVGLLVFSVVAIFAYVKFRRFRRDRFGDHQQQRSEARGTRPSRKVKSKVHEE